MAYRSELTATGGTSLAGRAALVTGAASGMGLAHARLLHARGARVAITDIDPARLDEAHRGFGAEADRIVPLVADNASVASVEAAARAATAAFGAVDILVNNAGVSGRGMPLEAIEEADFDAMIAVHLKGAFFFARALAPGMKQRGGGRIINISSHFSMVGCPAASHYAIAKTALNGMSRALAVELAPWRITVNTVAPALIETPMTIDSIGAEEIARRARDYPLGRLAHPEEVAYAVGWLASDEAAMVTGQVISPNGGVAVVGL